MSFLAFPPNSGRKPFAEILPDGRHRVTCWFKCTTTGEFPQELVGAAYAVNTLFPWTPAPTGWDTLRLTYKEMDDASRGFPEGGSDARPLVKVTWEEISETAETRVGANEFSQLPDGRSEVIQRYVMFSTSTYTPQTPGSSTASGLGSYYLWEETNTNDGTLRNIVRKYQTAGITATDDESLEGGALLLKKITSFKTVPSTPSGYTPIGTPVENPNGYPIYTYTFAKGTGLAAQRIASRQDGLREVTNIALGSRIAPVGVVIDDDYKQQDGYTIYTVTSMQGATGTSDVTTATQSYQRYVPFTYPGRAKAWVATVGSQNFLDVFLSPPVETLVLATVGISYTTTSTLTVSDFWNPNSWATMRATWVGAYGVAATRVQSYVGYRTTTATAVTLTSSGYNQAIFGFNIYNGATGSITVTGGPVDPGGSTWTLHAEVEPAFYDADNGTPYYRKTAVSAAIPSQSALPV